MHQGCDNPACPNYNIPGNEGNMYNCCEHCEHADTVPENELPNNHKVACSTGCNDNTVRYEGTYNEPPRHYPTEVALRRTSNGTSYNLGHFEQMQVAIALGLAIEEFEALDPEDRISPYKLGDADTLRSLHRLFSDPGTVTIVKNNEE